MRWLMDLIRRLTGRRRPAVVVTKVSITALDPAAISGITGTFKRLRDAVAAQAMQD